MSLNKEKLFTSYYNEYKDKLYTYILYRVNFNRANAEDLLSEIFLKAYKNFESFNQDKPFKSWIYKIARNHLINFYRDTKIELELTDMQIEKIITLKDVDVKIDAEKVMKKIYQLDDYSRDVLIMRYINEFDNQEIAEILGKNENAIRTQISRALNKIKDLMENI